MSVAIGKDDSWLGVKSQSNSEIAGFLRNPFRWGVKSLLMTLGDADLRSAPASACTCTCLREVEVQKQVNS